MEPDKYQQAWRADSGRTLLTINAALLREEVQREQQNFRMLVFWQDYCEAGISLAMILAWIYFGVSASLSWTWYLVVPVHVWTIAFKLNGRLRHRGSSSEVGQTMLQSVNDSLDVVDHQIWLLRNQVWLSQFPYGVAIMAFFTQVFWNASASSRSAGASGWWVFAAAMLFGGLILFVVFGWVHWRHLQTVRTQLEPRRQEFLTLLASLSEGAVGADSDGQVALKTTPFAEEGLRTPSTTPATKAKFAITILVCSILILLAVAMFIVLIKFIVNVLISTS